ncbi:putative arsenite methyltransferase [Eremomyces bilateralis CBS 781.70]|uniref:Arsenite methyltransferase n=1 Tax=Eremomyces bilateralis CBS 781.70 TaxID=1392243 RepID=A0A6G1G4G1_9PEZI|nr:putative arsenite methyltransferase [Eremomyces bilateralis CBS 781.70]KAF1812800.1 putative arsenite methyltransferase [Eremomyces bilateralis CBS 781.70]
MFPSSNENKSYTMGHTKSSTASHATRTIYSDASFLLPYIQPYYQILDIGCGPGTITAGFSELVPHGSVTGIDLGHTILQQARENTHALIARSPDVPRGETTYQEGDVVVGLKFEDNTFDVVFASQVLIHLPEQVSVVRALNEMRRLVKPGGIVATRDGAKMLFYPDYNLEKLWEQNLLKGIGLDEWPGPKMRGHYRQAGFDVDGLRENGQKQVIIGVGSNVYAGTMDERKAYIRTFTRRFNPGEPFRECWIKVGISEEEIQDCIGAFEKWANTEDAWATTVQSEVLAWK